MKNYFFVNPAAGQGRGTEKLVERIEEISKRLGETSFIYHTKDIGDGEIKARETAAALNGEPARFYACGGDGTLNEIINGIIGFSNVSAGCIPTGTGNDMIRNFPGAGDFSDIEAQLRGTLHRIDLIRYAGVISGVFKERYCANMFNIGFDCNVVELAGRLKKKPLISGSVAYLLAVAGMFIRKKGIALKLTEGEEILLDGENIFTGMDVNLLRKRVGMVFQKPNPFPMSIYDNIAYGPRTHGIRSKAKLDDIVEKSLRNAAIWDECKDRLKTSALGMSGGQQQRLCIARALAVEPEVLLMDEPTSALDPISTSKIEDLAMELKKDYTIVMVTHNMQQAVRVSDNTAFFLLGEVVEYNDTEKLFSIPSDKRTEDYITGRFG